MRDRRDNAIVASPILIGAVTVLVTVIAVFLAYNANEGLPFVPTYDVKVLVPDAAGLIDGNEVRIGGKRVGVVHTIDAQQTRSGVIARLGLRLDKTVQPLYSGAQVTVRPRSPLGLKYVELTPDRRGRPLAPGQTLALSAARPTVDLDEVLSALDPPTRRSLQLAVTGLGDGLAGRGADLNTAIAGFPPLLQHGERVAANLADPRTRLAGFVEGAARAAGELAPVAPQLGSLVRSSNVTAGALATVTRPLRQALEQMPAAEGETTSALVATRPVLAGSRALVGDIRPGADVLAPAAAKLHAAIVTGIPVVRRAVALSDRLRGSLRALDTLASDDYTSGALDRLQATVNTGLPLLRFITPMQTVCNYLGLWTRNVSSSISEGDASGTWFRTVTLAAPDEEKARAEPSPKLHFDPYGNTAAPGQEHECETGNEPYLPGQRIGHVPGNQGVNP